MSDYSITTDFSVKDALTTGDPEKIILGADFDVEFNAISTAITSKYDSNDIASTAQAQAGSSDAVLISPAKLTDWSQKGTGVIEDLWGYVDPNVDTIFGWDDSAGAAIGFTMGTGLTTSTTTIALSHLGFESLVDPNADRIAFWDDTAGSFAWLTVGTNLDITGTTLSAPTATLEAAISHDNLAAIPANDHIDHSTVSISAGTGLTGGGTIAATRTLSLSFLGLEALVDPNDDRIYFWDDSAGASAWLDLGTSLTITGTSIDVNYSDVEANLSTSTASLPIYAGYCDSAAAAEEVPSGWSIAKGATGTYTVTHNLGLVNTEDLAVTVTLINKPNTSVRPTISSYGANSFVILVDNDAGDADSAFFFMAIDWSALA